MTRSNINLSVMVKRAILSDIKELKEVYKNTIYNRMVSIVQKPSMSIPADTVFTFGLGVNQQVVEYSPFARLVQTKPIVPYASTDDLRVLNEIKEQYKTTDKLISKVDWYFARINNLGVPLEYYHVLIPNNYSKIIYEASWVAKHTIDKDSYMDCFEQEMYDDLEGLVLSKYMLQQN